jgi:hypothetical protein
VLGGFAFVAAFVIAGETRHQLLGACVIAVLHLPQEIIGARAAQGGGEATVMMDVNLAGLAGGEGEAEIILQVSPPHEIAAVQSQIQTAAGSSNPIFGAYFTPTSLAVASSAMVVSFMNSSTCSLVQVNGGDISMVSRVARMTRPFLTQ